jgi:hypothetical protein
MKTILASSLLAVSVLAAFLYANEPQQTTVDQVQTVIAAPTAAVDDGSETASALGGNGSAYTYCSATLNSFGTTARINYIGSLGVSQCSRSPSGSSPTAGRR